MSDSTSRDERVAELCATVGVDALRRSHEPKARALITRLVTETPDISPEDIRGFLRRHGYVRAPTMEERLERIRTRTHM